MRRPARKKSAPSPVADPCNKADACDAPLPPCGDQPAAGRAGVPAASAGKSNAPSISEAKPLDFTTAQELFAIAIMRPMTMEQHMQRAWIDGQSMEEVAAEFIKPNDLLSSYERLEIYNRQYWFRVVDCLNDDFPGLLAALGQAKFDALITEYLTIYPSSSYTLRNLGCRLVEFIEAEPKWVAPKTQLALDMARIEWAWIVAFDGAERTPLKQEDIQGRDPETLTLQLQPYLSLLELDYPLDDFLISLKKVEHLRTEASTGGSHCKMRRSRVPLPEREQVFMAVHRCDNLVYYKRLESEEYAILKGIAEGQSIAGACALALSGAPDSASHVQTLSAKIRAWFATWTELGWLCLAESP